MRPSSGHEVFRAAAGACMVLGLCNPFLMPGILTLLAALWLLQRPAPKVWTGVAAAPKPIRWVTAKLWGIIQGNVDHSRRGASLQGASKDKLLYHVAIGSNCNKDVLEGRRNVKPRKSMPCRIEGYELTFNHRGLPYWEPSFCTIAKAEDVATGEEVNGSDSPAAVPSNGKAAKSRTGHDTAVESAAAAQESTTAVVNGVSERATRATNGTMANGSKGGKGSSSSRGSSGSKHSTAGGTNGEVRTRGSPTVILWQGLVRLGSMLLGEAPVPVAARKYKGPRGQPELHGVVHQISEADMKQIQITEGGGGNQKMGYNLEEMTCTLYDGSKVQALGFTTHPCSRTCPSLGFAHPSERYLQIVRVGIAASGIDSHYQDWLQELQPYRRETWGQLIGSYIIVAMMFAAGGVVAAALVAHCLVLRRKLDGFYIHVVIQYIMSAVWWCHNHVLSHVFGRGS